MWGDGTIQCQVVLLVWIMVGQGHTVLAVDAGGAVRIFFFCRLSFFFSSSLCLGGWMDDFSIESQLYQDDGWVMDDCAQWKSHLRSKRSWPQAVLELGTTRLAGQRLLPRSTGTPVSVRWLDIDRNTV